MGGVTLALLERFKGVVGCIKMRYGLCGELVCVEGRTPCSSTVLQCRTTPFLRRHMV